jgi:hypothetical protein
MDSRDQLLSPTVVNLLAEKPNMDIDRIRKWIIVNVPYMPQDHIPREVHSAVSHQIFQQREFFAIQLDLSLSACYDMRIYVHF